MISFENNKYHNIRDQRTMKRTMKFYSNTNLIDPNRILMPIRQMSISNFTEAVTLGCDMNNYDDTEDYNRLFKNVYNIVTGKSLRSCVWKKLCLQLRNKVNNSASRIITLSKVNKCYTRRGTLKCPYFSKRNNEL